MATNTITEGDHGHRLLLRPSPERATRDIGVLWISGHATDMHETILLAGTNLSRSLDLIGSMADVFTVCVHDAGVNHASANAQFGTPEAVDVAMDGWDVLQAAGCDDRIVLCGLSHGFTTCVAFAAVYPEKVRGVVGFIPAANLEGLRERNFLGTPRAAIDAAWGVTYPDPLVPANETTEARAAVLGANGTPVRIWCGTADPFTDYETEVLPWWQDYLAAGGVDGGFVASVGTNHDNGSLPDEPYTLRSWIAGLA